MIPVLIYRLMSAVFVMLILLRVNACSANPLSRYMHGDNPHTVSQYTCLMDAATGKVLYYKNDLVHRPPASLTKMAAAIVLIENGRLSDLVTAPDAVTGTPESSLHLSPGETISLHDMLYAMLLRSANDTPIAGSYYLCGGIPPFVDLMNKKVKAIGCQNTNFVTPNGLYADGHYSCAYDLGLIARYGLTQLPFFREVVKTREYRVTRSIHKDDSLVTNTSMTFLSDFPGADGVKTGYISQAGHCFVGSATRNGFQLIAVALDSPECRSDVVQLLSYGYAHYRGCIIFNRGHPAGEVTLSNRTEPVETGQDLSDVVNRADSHPDLSLYHLVTVASRLPADQPIGKGQTVGTVTLYKSNVPIMTVDALATVAYPAVPASEKRISVNRPWPLARTLIIGAVAIIILPLLYIGGRILEIAIYARKITKNSRRRRTHFSEDV